MLCLRAIAGTVSANLLCAAALMAAQAGSSAPQQPQTVLRTQSTSVLVDVVVTDKGKGVRGIDRKRFHIFEDGTEQNVSFLEEHSPAMGAPAEKRRPLPPHLYTNLPSQPTGSAVNVLLLDALNTPVGNQVEVRKRMVKYIETIPPGSTMAIFTLASRLRMAQGFTSNVGDLIAALKSARANPQQSVALDSPTGSGTDSSNLSLMSGARPAAAALQAFQSDVNSAQTDQRAAMTLQALQNLARYLSGVPGRKNLIWFSGSFPTVLGPADITNPASGSRNYSDQVRNTSELLAAARVAVYPMAAEGLATLASFDVGNSGLGPGPKDPDLQNRFTMEEIAQETGGMALFNNNDFGAAVTKAIDDGASYYTIGYVPQSHDYHGQFRKLKVRIDDCDCHLSYRSGYYADSPDAPATAHLPATSLMTTATLHGAPPATQVLFQTRVLPASDSAVKDANLPSGPIGEMAATLKPPLERFVVDVAVDPRTLIFRTDNSSHATAIEFTLVAYDRDGNRLNYVDRDAQLSLNAEQYANLMSSGLPVRLAIDVPGGHNYLVIAVHDRVGARVGSLEVPLSGQ
ncbi:MAG TPA: VWA domain-containing protein [Terracidiphilus sp.]|nr:VWA domain-containing protein [Terracidiphilus sp.]